MASDPAFKAVTLMPSRYLERNPPPPLPTAATTSLRGPNERATPQACLGSYEA